MRACAWAPACHCYEGKKEVAKIVCVERLHFYLRLKKSVWGGGRWTEARGHICLTHGRCSEAVLVVATATSHVARPWHVLLARATLPLPHSRPAGGLARDGILATRNRTERNRKDQEAGGPEAEGPLDAGPRGSRRGGRSLSLPAASRTRVSGSGDVDTESASSFPAWFRFWLLTPSAKNEADAVGHRSANKNEMTVMTVSPAALSTGWRSAPPQRLPGTRIAPPQRQKGSERHSAPLTAQTGLTAAHTGGGLDPGCLRLGLALCAARLEGRRLAHLWEQRSTRQPPPPPPELGLICWVPGRDRNGVPGHLQPLAWLALPCPAQAGGSQTLCGNGLLPSVVQQIPRELSWPGAVLGAGDRAVKAQPQWQLTLAERRPVLCVERSERSQSPEVQSGQQPPGGLRAARAGPGPSPGSGACFLNTCAGPARAAAAPWGQVCGAAGLQPRHCPRALGGHSWALLSWLPSSGHGPPWAVDIPLLWYL